MTRVITYTLTLDEPCLLAAPGGDPNTEQSLPYIPGGAVRGALAAAYLRGSQTTGPGFDDLFLNGKVRYLNAYPLLEFKQDKNDEEPEGVRALPTPRAWTRLKDDPSQCVYNRAEKSQFKEADDKIPSGVNIPFVTFTDPITEAKPAFEIAVHTARNREKGRSIEGDAGSALFRYQALARGQQFAGAIVVDDDKDAAAIEQLLAGGSLLLGGSHNAGYGLAGVTTRQSPDQETEQQKNTWREVDNPAEDIPPEGVFIVYLTSHAILYDPDTGEPTADIRHFLPDGPGGYEIVHSFAAADWVGGFNKQRGLPLSQQWALQMGSTWVIKTGKPLSAQQINDLESAGIGARTEEGFGRLVINPQWPEKTFEIGQYSPPLIKKAPPKAQDKSPAPAAPPHPLLAQMNERIARAELDRRLAVQVNKLAVKEKVRGHLSRSQLGRLQVRVRRVATDDNYRFDKFITYLDGTRERKSADDQFRKFAVDGEIFRDYLRRLAENPATVWRIIGAQGDPFRHVGDAAFDFQANDELARRYTVKFIANLCRQLSKLEEKP